MKFRKKPVIIEATQWFKHGDHPKVTIMPRGRESANKGWIHTLEGGHEVTPGDWIITGVKGEHYPCKPDIFEATYERVEEEIQPDIAYSAEYDAYYYIDTGEWVEPRCGDVACHFCNVRPKNMKEKRVDETEKERHKEST